LDKNRHAWSTHLKPRDYVHDHENDNDTKARAKENESEKENTAQPSSNLCMLFLNIVSKSNTDVLHIILRRQQRPEQTIKIPYREAPRE
jgi:hypothetical protein